MLRSVVQHLAGVAKEGAALGCTEIFFNDLVSITCAGLLGMREPMFAKGILFLPFQEVKAVVAGFINEGI